jgi:hypothetical protein
MHRVGTKDSSLTRVQPVFNELLNLPSGHTWVQRLCEMATTTRTTVRGPGNLGLLVPDEVPREVPARMGKVFERAVAAPTAFLRWLICNPERMHCADEVFFGSRDPKVQDWRRQLLRGNDGERKTAMAEGLQALESIPAKHRQGKWWVFEGRSHIDCCLITESCVLFIEGKRTEPISPATQWFKQRSQLWRNVEAAEEFGREGIWRHPRSRERNRWRSRPRIWSGDTGAKLPSSGYLEMRGAVPASAWLRDVDRNRAGVWVAEPLSHRIRSAVRVRGANGREFKLTLPKAASTEPPCAAVHRSVRSHTSRSLPLVNGLHRKPHS